MMSTWNNHKRLLLPPHLLVRQVISKWNLLHLALIIASIFVFAPSAAMAQAHVRIEVEPSKGTVEDVFELRVILEGSNLRAYGQPKVEESYQFTLAYGGVMQNQVYVNGKGSESKIFTYELSPLPSLKPGKYKVPQITFESPSNSYDLNEPEIEITAETNRSGQVRNPAYEPRNLSNRESGGTIDFSQTVDELQPYVGQQVLYKTELVSTKQIASGVMSDIPFDGFWHEPLGKPKEELRQINQTTVRTYESAEAIFANKTGELTIPPRLLTAEVQVPLASRRHNDAWDDLRGGLPDPLDFIQAMRTVKKKYTTKPLTLNVKPLPEPPSGTAPATYVPVGQISMFALADKFDGKAGESISYSIELTGDGNLRPLDLGKPTGKDIDHFKIYADQPEVKTFIGGDKINFKKRFPISLIPRTPGTLELPTYSFLVFEPGHGYKILTTPHQTITVAPADPGSTTAVVPDSSSDQPQQTSDDLLPQHTGPETYLPAARPSKATLLFFVLIYPAIVILARLIGSARNKLDSDERLARQKRALESLNRRLKLIQNEHSAAASELFSALRIYLGDKLGFAGESATAGEIIRYSEAFDFPAEILSTLSSLVRELERSDYGGAALTPDRIADAKARTVELAKKIEAQKVASGREGRSAALAILVAATVWHLDIAEAEPPPIRTAAEAVQSADRAFASGDFSNAVSLYLQAQKLGATNGYIEYNLGNAYFRSGQTGRAIAHLRRSQSQLGSDPETEANLKYVRSQLKEKSSASCPAGSRSLNLPSPIGATDNQRLWTALSLWCFFWSMLGIGVWYSSGLLRFVTVAGLITSMASGAIYIQTIPGSTGEPCLKYSLGGVPYRSAVVVAPQIEVRSGDAAEAQVVAVLKEGAEISTGETRNGYMQIFLPTGRSGFVPLDSIELI